MRKIIRKNIEKTFTETDEVMYNGSTDTKTIAEQALDEQLKADRYLPTNDVAFRKMLSSPDNIHISEGLLNDLAQNDPLGALQIDKVVIASPYNFKAKNKLKNRYEKGILYTEVDYACADPDGAQFLIELQCYKETHLEKRISYNISERYTSNYGGKKRKDKRRAKRKKLNKYESLRPVIGIIILNESYYKSDSHPIRYLRPCDTSINVHKKDLLMGLEIYLELDKDVSEQPRNIQDIFQFFRTGTVSATAADYLKEATEQMVKINYSPAEQKLADFYIRAQLKRDSEDDYIREEEREKADIRVKEERVKADIREGQARKEEREKADAEKVELLQKEREKSDVEKAELLERIRHLELIISDDAK